MVVLPALACLTSSESPCSTNFAVTVNNVYSIDETIL